MTFRLQPQYIGSVQAVIFDIAGTIFDHGSVAPIIAFQQLFESIGIPITQEEARIPMGSEKREHIRQLLDMPRIEAAWREKFTHIPNGKDIDQLYNDFVPFQIKAIHRTAQPINGLTKTINFLQRQGCKIACNTGYAREMADAITPYMQSAGFKPDSFVCATEVPRGRPYPDMSLKNALEVGVDCMQACVKVDDTGVGIQEGLNAGMWTVGVALSGNEVGMSEADWDNLTGDEKELLKKRAYQKLYQAGAHFVIDSISTLPTTIKDINQRLSSGQKP